MLRRALRHAFTLLSALSLLLCVAVCVLWVRSRTATDVFYVTRPIYSVDLSSLTDGIAFEYMHVIDPDGFDLIDPEMNGNWVRQSHLNNPDAGRNDIEPPQDIEHFFFDSETRPLITMHQRAGFVFASGDSWGNTYVVLICPHWFLVAALLVLPAVTARRQLARRSRRARGLCSTCGYDLRAHAAGARCPECGAAIAAPSR